MWYIDNGENFSGKMQIAEITTFIYNIDYRQIDYI